MPDVVVLRWPADQAEVERLTRLDVPKLLLLDPAADPPSVDDPLTEWVRLPADERDVSARLELLRRRSGTAVRPTLDEHGCLRFGAQWVVLSVGEERLARVFVDHFDDLVSEDLLVSRGWSHEQLVSGGFRLQLHRLRRRIEPLGLAIRMLRNRGYAMHVVPGAGVASASSPHAS